MKLQEYLDVNLLNKMIDLGYVLVNMDYINGQKDTFFIVKNGDKLPINIRNKRQILQSYRNYIFENM